MEWYCLVTLTDLQTRRAGLTASAELLVDFIKKNLFLALTAFNTNANTFLSYHKCSKCRTLDFNTVSTFFSKTLNRFVLRRYVNARVSFYCGSFDCIQCNQVTLTQATS